MTEQIISRATIRAKARAAFDRGVSRNDHNMNPGAAAIFDWLEEYDRCASQVTKLTRSQVKRVDVAQVSA